MCKSESSLHNPHAKLTFCVIANMDYVRHESAKKNDNKTIAGETFVNLI